MKKIRNFLLERWQIFRENYTWKLDFTEYIRRKDKTTLAKVSSAIGYLFFFVPSIMVEGNQFAQFHTNQSLLNLLLSLVGGALVGSIPYIGFVSLMLLELFCLFNVVRGIVLSLQGKCKGIPVFGYFTIVHYRFPGQ